MNNENTTSPRFNITITYDGSKDSFRYTWTVIDNNSYTSFRETSITLTKLGAKHQARRHIRRVLRAERKGFHSPTVVWQEERDKRRRSHTSRHHLPW